MDESNESHVTHGNLEIRNPIFDEDLNDLNDDSITSGLNPAYSLDTEDEKVIFMVKF